MGINKISRKEFVTKALAGITGITLVAENITRFVPSVSWLRAVGNTGINVSPICFGAPRTNDISLIKYALEKGINFIDTGRAYGNRNNEQLVGRAIAGERDKVVIQSKIRLEENELPSGAKGRKGAAEIRDALLSKFEASMKALNTSYIDIMLYHEALDEKLLFHNETMKFFADMKKSGVIKAYGFSTHNDCMNLAERNNSERFYDIIMVPFNHKGAFVHSITGQYSEWDQIRLISILTEAGRKGIGVIAMKTCSGGKYSQAPGIEASYKEAVLWVLKHNFISSASLAMVNFEQIDENVSWIKDQ